MLLSTKDYFHEVMEPIAFTYTVSDLVLNFHDHIVATCDSASKTTGFIMRVALQFQNSRITVIVYNAYVRPKLEYNPAVWDPGKTEAVL